MHDHERPLTRVEKMDLEYERRDREARKRRALGMSSLPPTNEGDETYDTGEPRTLSETQAAGWLGLTKRQLSDRRKRGTGPAVASVRGEPSYRMVDLNDWVERAPPSYKPGRIVLPAGW